MASLPHASARKSSGSISATSKPRGKQNAAPKTATRSEPPQTVHSNSNSTKNDAKLHAPLATARRSRRINRNDIVDNGGSTSFGRTYFSLCELHSLPILTELMTPALESRNQLHLDVDRIRRDEDWTPLLTALRQNRDLAQIHVFSNEGVETAERQERMSMQRSQVTTTQPQSMLQKGTKNRKHVSISSLSRFDARSSGASNPQSGAVHRMLPHLLISVRECLANSPFMTKLEVAGVHLRENTVSILAKALYKNQTIQELSLARTDLGDSGLYQLAPSIRTILHLRALNLGACNLTEHGAHIMAALLKSLAVRRQADQWAWSLRLSPGDMERLDASHVPSDIAPRPLRRLNLCLNHIGDAGCEALLDLVREEVGLLALDLQMNGLTDRSAQLASSVLQQNIEIVVLDMRNNPIDAVLLYSVHERLAKNDERRQQSATSRNGSTSHRDADLVWLDGERPLKETFHAIGPTVRQRMHTESSVRKRRGNAVVKDSVRPASSASHHARSGTPKTGLKPYHRLDTTQLEKFMYTSVQPSGYVSDHHVNTTQKNHASITHTHVRRPPALVALETHLARIEAARSRSTSPVKSSQKRSVQHTEKIQSQPVVVQLTSTTHHDASTTQDTSKQLVNDRLNATKEPVGSSSPLSMILHDPYQDTLLPPLPTESVNGPSHHTPVHQKPLYADMAEIATAIERTLDTNNNLTDTDKKKRDDTLVRENEDLRRRVEELEKMVRDTIQAMHRQPTSFTLSEKPVVTEPGKNDASVGSETQPSMSGKIMSQPVSDVVVEKMEVLEMLPVFEVQGTAKHDVERQIQADLASIMSIESAVPAAHVLAAATHELQEPSKTPVNVSSQSGAIATLIELMESSLSSFHSMLDRIDEQQEQRRQRRLERKNRLRQAASAAGNRAASPAPTFISNTQSTSTKQHN